MYLMLSFKFHTKEEVERFLTLLERHVKTPYLVTTRLTHVYIQLEGNAKELKDAAAVVKSLAGLARGARRSLQIPLLVLFRDAELVRPVPPDAIADALTATGHPSTIRGDVLTTTASYEEALSVAEKLSKLYEEAERLPLTPHAKKIAVVYAFAKGLPVERAVEELINEGLLNRGGVISLRYRLEEARRMLQSKFK
jgi:hypothetical protein